jgi:thioredoxin
MTTILTDENFEAEIKKADKPVLVDFFATWCEPCNMLSPVLDKIAEDLKDKIILMKVNVDGVPEASQKFNVDRIPMVVLFENGQPVSSFTGFMQEGEIKEWLNNALPNKEEMAERFDNYAKSNGFRLNPDKKVVERVINGLLANEKKYAKRYCPCRRVSENEEEDSKKICPCAFHKDEIEKDGHCFCNLFVK